MDLLFKCSNQLLNRDYGMAHILVYAAENEEIKVDNPDYDPTMTDIGKEDDEEDEQLTLDEATTKGKKGKKK